MADPFSIKLFEDNVSGAKVVKALWFTTVDEYACVYAFTK